MSKFFIVEDEQPNLKVLIFNREDQESNVLSAPVLRELNDVIEGLARERDVGGLVIMSGKSKQFIAGADIKEIEKFKNAEEAAAGAAVLQQIFSKIEKLPFPTVAAINGACLGGGLEMSLCCTWRVVTDADYTQLALPEIQLGLIPGAGGTQRLPRLIGIQNGLDLILTGKRVNGAKAYKMGLADAVVHPNQLRSVALEFAQRKRKSESHSSITQIALEKNPIGRRVMQAKAREAVEKNTKGFYPAAFRALDVVFKGIERKLEKGLELEAQYFGELAATRESQSLIHLFHATTAIKKHPYKGKDEAVFGKKPVSLVGVVGAGFMGAGVANVCVAKNIRVRMSDPSPEAIGRALNNTRKHFEKQAKRRRIKSFEVDQKMVLLSPELKPDGFGDCDVVVEAVFEDINLKRKILAGLEKDAGKNWIFASNTSALPIGDIARDSKHPERIIGMHFFSPVEKMPLLEVIITDKTADWVTARVVELGQRIGKQVIVVKDGPGFYTTRALSFYLNEAALMLSEGAKIDKIDKALTDFGFPVGPITLIDEVGIDVGAHVLETMEKSFSNRVTVPEGVRIVLDSGRLGRKNQKGFYTYKEGKKTEPDNEIYQLLSTFKVAPKGIPSDEIVDRCLLIFVNESIRCLEEGILPDPYSGDVGAVFGLGFPPFWGGPFRYVDHIGASVLVERLRALEEKYGSRFRPAKLLSEYAQKNKLFFPEEKNH